MHAVGAHPEPGDGGALHLQKRGIAERRADRIGLVAPAGDETVGGEPAQRLVDGGRARREGIEARREDHGGLAHAEGVGEGGETPGEAVLDPPDAHAAREEGTETRQVVGVALADAVEIAHRRSPAVPPVPPPRRRSRAALTGPDGALLVGQHRLHVDDAAHAGGEPSEGTGREQARAGPGPRGGADLRRETR